MLFFFLAYVCRCTFLHFAAFHMYFYIKYILLYFSNHSTIIRTLLFFSSVNILLFLFASIFFHKVLFIVLIICISIIFVVVLLSWCDLHRNRLFLLFILSLLLYHSIKSTLFSALLSVFSYKYIFLLYSLNLLISRPVYKASDRNS